MTETQSGRRLGWRETVAASGVVLSLLFVGLEIRQNTQAVRGATLQAVADAHANFMLGTYMDDDLQAVIPRVFAGTARDSFTMEENSRLNAFYMIFLAHLENTYVQRNAGFIDDEVFESYGWRNVLLTTTHFRQSTEGGLLEAAVSPEFRQFFVERVGW